MDGHDPILAAVRAGANIVLAALVTAGVDLAFGVGNYKDFESGAPWAGAPAIDVAQIVARTLGR